MDSEIRNELFTLLREVNDAGVMKDSQLRDCIDELDEKILTTRREPAADTVDVFDAADSDSWPPPEMKDAPFIRYLHKIMKYHQPTITPQECWVAIGAVRMWMSRHPDRAMNDNDRAVPIPKVPTEYRRRIDRAVEPEPAADAIEHAAKAIHEFRYQSGDEPRSWEGILKAETKYHVDHGSQWYRQLAGAALQAAAVEPEPGLDAVEWEEIHVSKGDDGTGVVIEVEGVPDSRGRHVVIATGATLGEAIAAAVRQAKENGDG